MFCVNALVGFSLLLPIFLVLHHNANNSRIFQHSLVDIKGIEENYVLGRLKLIVICMFCVNALVGFSLLLPVFLVLQRFLVQDQYS